MEKITTYKANDGTIFSNEQECRDYENSMFFHSLGESKFWGVEKSPIISVDNLAEEVYYAYFDSTEHLMQFEHFMQRNGYYGPSYVNEAKPGFYWTEDGEFWESYDYEKLKLKRMAALFNLE